MVPRSHEASSVMSRSSSYPAECAAVQSQAERDRGEGERHQRHRARHSEGADDRLARERAAEPGQEQRREVAGRREERGGQHRERRVVPPEAVGGERAVPVDEDAAIVSRRSDSVAWWRDCTTARPGIGVRATASPGPARGCETFPHPIPEASDETGRRGPGIVVPGRGVHSLPAPCEPESRRFVSPSPTNGEPESHHS